MLVGEDDTRPGTPSWRAITAVCLALAILIAWYVGFRLPNAWATTLQTVSITDGFHRRFAVGTLLRPLALATDYDYWLFATFSFAVLAALISILVVVALRTKSLARRMIVVAFFLLPTGAFTFHIVGYLDQVLYLMLFVAIWLLGRQRVVAATVVMSVAPFVHEIAILSVLPVFGIVALRRAPLKTAVLITLIPTAINAILFAIPIASDGAVESLVASLQTASFHHRPDALAVFARTQTETWKLYNVHEVVVRVRPFAMFITGAYAGLWWSARSQWRDAVPRLRPILVLLVTASAIALPSLLVYAGWDHNRWLHLILCNFLLVVWLMIDDARPLATKATVVLFTVLLAVGHIKLDFFEPDVPRPLTYRDARQFLRELGAGVLTQTPRI